jgi:voltage-gated potassium channel
MILITFGMGVILYGISTLTAMIIEGELTGILRKSKMEKQIGKLSNHYIVCGGGETGYHVIAELVKNGENVVLVELDEEKIERCKMIADLLFVKGDATEDENLVTAGIDKAKGIVISLPSDKDTLYVTMASRMRNRNLRIISRMVDHKHESKLRNAGADGVVSPNFIGGLRMASEMLRPTVVDFLDSMLRSSQGNLRIHEVTVSPASIYKGKTIAESGFKEKFGLLIMGARHPGKDIQFNPSPSIILEEGMTLIVMGDVESIVKARKVF